MTRPLAPPSPSRPDIGHPLEYQEAQRFVQRKTRLGLHHFKLVGERRRVLEDLTRALLQRARATMRDGMPGAGLEATFEAVFSDLILESFERDEATRWLVTEARIEQVLRETNGDGESQDSRSVRGDRLQEARCRALKELDGGRYPLRKYQEKVAAADHGEGLTFWGYYLDAVRKKTISPFRIKSFVRSFWDGKDSLEAEVDEDCPRPEPRDRHGLVERALVSVQRQEKRREVLEQVRQIAHRGAFPSAAEGERRKADPNCAVMLKYIDWLLARPEGEELQDRQTSFARDSGIPAGTVSAALKRFREKYGYDKSSREWRDAHLYTTHGGSAS